MATSLRLTHSDPESARLDHGSEARPDLKPGCEVVTLESIWADRRVETPKGFQVHAQQSGVIQRFNQSGDALITFDGKDRWVQVSDFGKLRVWLDLQAMIAELVKHGEIDKLKDIFEQRQGGCFKRLADELVALEAAEEGGTCIELLEAFELPLRHFTDLAKSFCDQAKGRLNMSLNERREARERPKWEPTPQARLLANFIGGTETVAVDIMDSIVENMVIYKDSLQIKGSEVAAPVVAEGSMGARGSAVSMAEQGSTAPMVESLRPRISRRIFKKLHLSPFFVCRILSHDDEPSCKIEYRHGIRRVCINSVWMRTSKLSKVTLPLQQRRAILIPDEADKFAYVYPMDTQKMIGGFLYLKSRKSSDTGTEGDFTVLGMNPITVQPRGYAIRFKRPREVNFDDAEQHLLLGADTTIGEFRRQGAVRYAWVGPNEKLSCTNSDPKGGFMYKFDDGVEKTYLFFEIASTERCMTTAVIGTFTIRNVAVLPKDAASSEIQDCVMRTAHSWRHQHYRPDWCWQLALPRFDTCISYLPSCFTPQMLPVTVARLRVPGILHPIVLLALVQAPSKKSLGTLTAQVIAQAALQGVFWHRAFCFVGELLSLVGILRISWIMKRENVGFNASLDNTDSIEFNASDSIGFINASVDNMFINASVDNMDSMDGMDSMVSMRWTAWTQLLLIVWVMNAVMEAVICYGYSLQLTQHPWKKIYFGLHMWKITHLFVMLALIVCLFNRSYMFADHPAILRALLASAGMVKWVRTAEILSTVEGLGQMILPIIHAMYGSCAFLGVSTFFVLGCWQTAYALSGQRGWEVLVKIYRLAFLADFNEEEDAVGGSAIFLDRYDGEHTEFWLILEFVLFIIVTLLLTTTLLNIFIGVMSKAYDDCMSRAEEIFVQHRLRACLPLILYDVGKSTMWEKVFCARSARKHSWRQFLFNLMPHPWWWSTEYDCSFVWFCYPRIMPPEASLKEGPPDTVAKPAEASQAATCPCGQTFGSNDVYCTSCGEKLAPPESVLCECGNTFGEGHKFCNMCGKAREISRARTRSSLSMTCDSEGSQLVQPPAAAAPVRKSKSSAHKSGVKAAARKSKAAASDDEAQRDSQAEGVAASSSHNARGHTGSSSSQVFEASPQHRSPAMNGRRSSQDTE